MQQLHGFDKSRNDQKVNENRTAKVKTTAVWLYLSVSYITFLITSTSQMNERMKSGENRVFGRSDVGQENF
jgi:hypothetical protein